MKLSKKNAMLTLETYLKDANILKYEHSLRVAEMCQILAKKWNPTLSEDAIIAVFCTILENLLLDKKCSINALEKNLRCMTFPFLKHLLPCMAKLVP